MTEQVPTLENLFQQLGLAHDQPAIEHFIKNHSPLDDDIRLADAPFWEPSQATLLREKILEDDVWSDAVDQLNLRLRG
jgi:hypothetical protein